MSEVSRRKEYADQTRNALVESGYKLFTEKGFMQTSLDDIAHDARVTKGAVYHHFKNKKDIYAACYETQAKALAKKIAKVPYIDDPWEEAIERAVAFLNFGKKMAKKAIPLQEAISILGWQRWKEIDSQYTLGYVKSSAQRLLASGKTKAYPEPLLVDILYGLMIQTSISIVNSSGKKQALKDASVLVADLIMGLRDSGQ